MEVFNNINYILMKPIVFMDLESTGTDLAKDKIVQFAAMKVHQNTAYSTPKYDILDRMDLYINPGRPIPPEVTAIHGITDEMVKDCPRFNVVAPRINAFISGCDLSGFNIKRFDIPFLAEEMINAGIPFTLSGRNVIDPFILYKILNSQSLAAAYKKYTGKEIENAHNAMADVEASFTVLEQMQIQGHVPTSVEELLAFQANGESFDSMVDFAGKFVRNKDGVVLLNFGKHRGRAAKENLDFVEWMVGKDFTKDTIHWCYELLGWNQPKKQEQDLFS